MYRIEEFDAKDNFDILAISEDEWKIPISSIIYNMSKNSVEKILVLRENEKIIGFIYMFVLPNKLLIPEFMYIKKEHRKRGHGSKLLKEAEKRSGCEISQIFFDKGLSKYYTEKGYKIGENLRVAIKEL